MRSIHTLALAAGVLGLAACGGSSRQQVAAAQEKMMGGLMNCATNEKVQEAMKSLE